MLGAVLVAGCAPVPTATPPVVERAPVAAPVPAGFAELTVFNVSGWTLIPSNQDIADNGHPLVSLPRGTHARFFIAPGPHRLSLHSRSLALDAKAGERYLVAAGYRPERSWLLPIMGNPVVIRLISDAEARELAKESKAE